MIQKIKSLKVQLPPIYLVENAEDFKTLPKGIPFIIGSQSELKFITIFLEFQVLYKSCLSLGIPVKWLDCLKRVGYNIHNIKGFNLSSGGTYESAVAAHSPLTIDDFIEEQYLVNFDKLSDLKLLPKWLEDLKSSIEVNIVDEVTFDPLAFNKQLGINIGYAGLKHNMKNLLILDQSSSIPKSVSMTTAALAKLMSKKFYADIIFTASESVFLDYNDIETTDIIALSNSIGRSNEGVMFREIVKKPKEYNTVISFGDNDSPAGHSYGAIECNFKCETLYSLHTEKTSTNITGYAKCLNPTGKTHIVNDWINTIKK